ncbi:hypothetical protein PoB_006815500 [Plakobranchus ocellatus]|uniref:Uncharacterized protein n=1 Tax=Plakobranchus ocellatus TaxID=259542 RepID=A0AAV4DC36_9GAST|nr:hypothetical protein PoB_006815500 [Plakobranchus ocellatus]
MSPLHLIIGIWCSAMAFNLITCADLANQRHAHLKSWQPRRPEISQTFDKELREAFVSDGLKTVRQMLFEKWTSTNNEPPPESISQPSSSHNTGPNFKSYDDFSDYEEISSTFPDSLVRLKKNENSDASDDGSFYNFINTPMSAWNVEKLPSRQQVALPLHQSARLSNTVWPYLFQDRVKHPRPQKRHSSFVHTGVHQTSRVDRGAPLCKPDFTSLIVCDQEFVSPSWRNSWKAKRNEKQSGVREWPSSYLLGGAMGRSRPQQGDLRLSGTSSGQGAGGGARTRNRRVPADLRAAR